jgi:hypothetical protein
MFGHEAICSGFNRWRRLAIIALGRRIDALSF